MSKKVALVTGGTRGIGFGIAKRLASDGFDIVVFGTKEQENAQSAIDELNSLGSKTTYCRADIANTAAASACVGKVITEYGRLDALVNNAGVAPKVRADILETTEESFDYVIDTNLKGTFFISQAVARQMVKQEDGGVIINISSISSYAVSANRPEYCISKAGISMMTKLFAERFASQGIRVYEVRPGVIMTDMTASVKEKYDGLIADGKFPIKRWGSPEDVAKAVSALCSGAFPYSTGDVINVDGGFHLQRL